jgi:signal transduction histidine kinase
MTTSPQPLVLIVTGPTSVIDDLRRILEPAGIQVRPPVEGGAPAEGPAVVTATASEAPVGAGRPPDAELSAWAHRSHHDLMTPLAVISGMAETLEAAWERLPEADRARLLGAIRNQATRATTMLDDVFAVARRLAGEPGDEAPPPGG